MSGAAEMVRRELATRANDPWRRDVVMVQLLGWIDSTMTRPVTAQQRRDIREAIAEIFPSSTVDVTNQQVKDMP